MNLELLNIDNFKIIILFKVFLRTFNLKLPNMIFFRFLLLKTKLLIPNHKYIMHTENLYSVFFRCRVLIKIQQLHKEFTFCISLYY